MDAHPDPATTDEQPISAATESGESSSWGRKWKEPSSLERAGLGKAKTELAEQRRSNTKEEE